MILGHFMFFMVLLQQDHYKNKKKKVSQTWSEVDLSRICYKKNIV